MLIDFSVTNFKSIKDKVVFSMEAAGKVKEFPDHVFKANNKHLLKTAIIYGRNSAGKSNLIEALQGLKAVTTFDGGIENGDILKRIKPYKPFKLSAGNIKKPVVFEVNFIADNGNEYNYYVSFTANTIEKERLQQKGLVTPMFERQRDKILVKRKEIADQLNTIEKGLFANQTIISKLATEKIDELLPVFNFFSGTLAALAFNHNAFSELASVSEIYMLKLPAFKEFKQRFNQVIRAADLTIERFEIVKKTQTDIISERAKIWETVNKEAAESGLGYKIVFIHKDNKGKEVQFEFDEESSGTQKFFHIAFWFIARMTTSKAILYLDEMDQSLHPELTKFLIEIFQDSKLNLKGSQLIFASHDVTQLSNKLFRRDEVWFADKDDNGVTSYYTLSDVNGVRPSVNYEKYYLKGAFGASPVINKNDLNW